MFRVNIYTISFKFLIISLVSVFFLSACSTNKSYSHTKKRRYKTKRVYKKRTKTKKDHKIVDSKVRNNIIGTAKKYIGTPYVYGGKNPRGFDCSGFVTFVMNKNGMNMQGSSRMLAKKGKKKSIKSLKKGDLVFFGSNSKVSHIALVLENQDDLRVIHSTSSRGVVIDNITASEYWTKKYLFGKSVF